MFASIISYGLAVGAVYALIGITYNVMFSASRVFSFTAGMLGMLGGVLGALFIKDWPGIYGTVTWTPEQHNGFPDQEVVMCEVNSLKDGAFNIAPGYSS